MMEAFSGIDAFSGMDSSVDGSAKSGAAESIATVSAPKLSASVGERRTGSTDEKDHQRKDMPSSHQAIYFHLEPPHSTLAIKLICKKICCASFMAHYSVI